MKKNNFFESLKHPFLIAEISANHNGSLKNCLNLIKSAKKNGADAVKIQTYPPEAMTINSKRKAIQISGVSRILKETAIDCMLNKGQTNLSTSIMKQSVNLELSCGKEIIYDVGDHPYTAVCDYMKECSYGCKPYKSDININMGQA